MGERTYFLVEDKRKRFRIGDCIVLFCEIAATTPKEESTEALFKRVVYIPLSPEFALGSAPVELAAQEQSWLAEVRKKIRNEEDTILYTRQKKCIEETLSRRCSLRWKGKTEQANANFVKVINDHSMYYTDRYVICPPDNGVPSNKSENSRPQQLTNLVLDKLQDFFVDGVPQYS
jgi:hypothetical protein